ncbi:histidine kinase/DNA gyrase B/HSP90-like ATPase [Pontibacter ummariensis]|uniref:histidine kinase n=1 Tax=Pontibacter ummariensis TaxID=1610492 RepID=A0A239GXT2_9BACT|nr:ATP-binding protein [Pontibacter ummariensis]PRY11016.1 histidine kinase/DNA gyrase B/HSP90-like ATPase [Pontibacter ummariensis]SNS72854.1 Histidine kinase-, DNA gyrase B-, and HSP90-like ATPase [Pontibacter ummariensis]
MIPIYSQKNRIKLVFVIIALIIGAATITYTNILVSKLSEREQELVQLYAKGLRYMINAPSDDNIVFIEEEILSSNHTVPVILTDENENILDSKNIDLPENISPERLNELLQREIEKMKAQHVPIEVPWAEGSVNYVFYKDSALLSQLRFYPYVQLIVIACFVSMAYFAFSYSRRAEQNQVWVGLAKETAHQLGTPLSSLMAWYEYIKASPKFDKEPIIEELGKDVRRLEIITERFSNIGSVPLLRDENILQVTQNAINYLQNRISRKVDFTITSTFSPDITAKLNVSLFDWVIENICKNAVDAMEGRGSINIQMVLLGKSSIAVDITDTGKGIPKSKIDSVFLPGFTTKKRGWGLGLALAKRIIDNYHEGKLFVKWSEVGKGTTFRIVLNR